MKPALKKIWSALSWKSKVFFMRLKHPKEGEHTIMCLAAGYSFDDIDTYIVEDEKIYGCDPVLDIHEKREDYCREEITYWEE
jgi:hypothetical protein